MNGIQRNLIGSKISTSTTKFVFLGRSEKQNGRPGLWLAETLLTSPLKLLNRIQENSTGSKILTSSTMFVFFGPIGKIKWPPWPLIGLEIFDFSSETAERNSTEFDRKQDLNALYRVCVFRADRKNKMAALASDWLRDFDFSSETAVRNSTKLDRKQDLNALYQVCVFGPIGKTRWLPWPLIGWDIFDFFSETAVRNSTKLDRKQDLNALYQVCVFRADRKNKMATLASDWLRHFQLLLWNRWTEFNETWQEARSQRHLPSFMFFEPIGKTLPPWPLIGWDIFDFSSENAERNSTKLDRKQDLNVFYQVCVFWADRKNKMAAPAIDWLGHFRLLLWNHPLPSLCFGGWSVKTKWLGRPMIGWDIFSSPEPKAQVSYCHSAPSVVRPSVRPSSSSVVNFHIFNFFYRTAWWILMKLGMHEVLMVPYKCCCFSARSAQGWIQGGAKIGHGGSPSSRNFFFRPEGYRDKPNA